LRDEFPAEVWFMAKDKDDKDNKDKDPFSDSGELFESIFRDAISAEETKKGKKGPAGTPRRPREKVPPHEPLPAIERPVRKKTTEQAPLEKTNKPDKPKKPQKPLKLPKLRKSMKTKIPRTRKSSGSRKGLLLLFLLILVGAGLFFYGDTLGLGGIVDTLSGTVSSIKQKILGPDEPKVALSRKSAGATKRGGTPPAAQKPAPSKGSTAEKPPAPVRKAKVETPKAPKPATPAVQGKKTAPVPEAEKVSKAAVKTPVPSRIPQKEASTPPQRTPTEPAPKPKPTQPVRATPEGPESKKAAPVPKVAKPPDAAVKTATSERIPQNTVRQTTPEKKLTTQATALSEQHKTAKASAPARAVQKGKTPSSYPYSVYLGAYKTLNRAKRAVAIHQGQGLSPYWVKVDLGSKGVWYRVFEGHFASQEAAETFVREKKLEEAEVKKTRYTNLIGIYSTAEDLRSRSLALLKRGYCPYAIPEGNGHIGLYTGAFYTRAGAETQHQELVSLGIQNQVVTR
jgi:hypothetical protein